MAATELGATEAPRLVRLLSLRQLYWVTVVLPLAFVATHHYLMIGPMHPFFHTWLGFVMFMVPLAIIVWGFSNGVFSIFRGMQQEIGALHEEREALVVEREREHLAHEMHDGLAQVLGFVNMKAQAVEEYLRGGDTASARMQMAELSAAAREVYGDIRQGIVALRAHVDAGGSLREALDGYVDEFARSTRIPVTVQWDVEERELELAPIAKLQLLRIVQEALANVRRHARAESASVRLSATDSELGVAISDDGVGFDPTVTRDEDRPHVGLHTMKERAEAAGGSVEVESVPGRGTAVYVRLPRASQQTATVV
ncbi:MAG: sensor histidine kinase [Planctomycetota bacterium]|jgi:signal transduction histidine kinase